MALVSEVTSVRPSGLNHIDALLDDGPGWNWLTPARSVVYYTFSVAGGKETGNSDISGGITAFNSAQQSACLSQLAYVTQLTGITFSTATSGTAADIHFANTNIIADSSTNGLCSWSYSYSYNGSNTVTSYSTSAYVYLDNVEWGTQNASPVTGNLGYETLLHELGHALGLKHPFEGSPTLPPVEDNTSNSIMSYTVSGGPYSTFRPYDVAALMWLYGDDGLGGSLGVSSAAVYLMGNGSANLISGGSGNDKLEGLAGNDTINGGAGLDTAIYSGTRTSHTVTQTSSGWTVSSGPDGTDTIQNIERLQFSNETLALDINGDAGQAYRVYQAAFNRTPDNGGLKFWIDGMDHGTSLHDVAAGFINSDEFRAIYGSNPTNEQFVTNLYAYVMHRPLDQAGYDFWVGDLNANRISRVDTLVQFSESPENQANVIGVIQNGIDLFV